jgi:hypothetical protein
MNTKNTIVVGLLSILIIILVVLILKTNKEDFKVFNLSKCQYNTLEASRGPNGELPSSNGMSWQSYANVENPALAPIYNHLYNRSCRPALISRMPTYIQYLPENKFVSTEGNN